MMPPIYPDQSCKEAISPPYLQANPVVLSPELQAHIAKYYKPRRHKPYGTAYYKERPPVTIKYQEAAP